MRLSEAFQQYCLEEITLRHLSDKTRRNYLSSLNTYMKYMGDIPMEFITEDTVVQWRVKMEATGHASSSIATNLSHLRNVLKYLKKRGHEVLDSRDIELPRIASKKPTWLTTPEIENLLSVITSPRDKAIVACLFSTGARISELLNLNREDIQNGHAEIIGKGDKPGTLYFHDYALKILDEYLATRKDSLKPLFISGQRRRITVSRIEQLMHEYSDAAGIEKNVTPHVMRHSFASDLKLNGADIYDIMKQLRHSQMSSTKIYTHIADKQIDDNHKKYHSGLSIR